MHRKQIKEELKLKAIGQSLAATSAASILDLGFSIDLHPQRTSLQDEADLFDPETYTYRGGKECVDRGTETEAEVLSSEDLKKMYEIFKRASQLAYRKATAIQDLGMSTKLSKAKDEIMASLKEVKRQYAEALTKSRKECEAQLDQALEVVENEMKEYNAYAEKQEVERIAKLRAQSGVDDQLAACQTEYNNAKTNLETSQITAKRIEQLVQSYNVAFPISRGIQQEIQQNEMTMARYRERYNALLAELNQVKGELSRLEALLQQKIQKATAPKSAFRRDFGEQESVAAENEEADDFAGAEVDEKFALEYEKREQEAKLRRHLAKLTASYEDKIVEIEDEHAKLMNQLTNEGKLKSMKWRAKIKATRKLRHGIQQDRVLNRHQRILLTIKEALTYNRPRHLDKGITCCVSGQTLAEVLHTDLDEI